VSVGSIAMWILREFEDNKFAANRAVSRVKYLWIVVVLIYCFQISGNGMICVHALIILLSQMIISMRAVFLLLTFLVICWEVMVEC